jgi:hypothetical protein
MRVLKASQSRSDLFHVARRWTTAVDQRRKGLSSRWPLFLGGDAWRTPMNGGSDTRGLDCFSFLRFRVFFVKLKVLSSNSRFARARDARTFVKKVSATY